MKKAVLFLIFNRPEVTQKVFNAIREARPPRLYIASDGARFNKEEELEIVDQTRKLVLDGIDWDCEVKTLFRDENLGCRNAVSGAISWFFENEKDGIILEDDCLPSQSFFKFCEELLDYYKNEKKVMHISGHRFAPNFKDDASYYFAKVQHCWGWASWADRWKMYGTDLNNYEEKNIEKFSEDADVQNYWLEILNGMKNNKIDSWAYQWAFKIIENNGVCINPSINLISNIGFGSNSTHTSDENDPYASLPVYEMKEINHPADIKIDQEAVNYIYQNHYGINFYRLELASAKSRLALTEDRLGKKTNELNMLYASREWKLILMLRKIVKRIIPAGSLRRKMAVYAWRIVKRAMKFFFKIKRGISGSILFLKQYSLRFKPRKKRKINKNSKKLVYIGHSYHNKTKSTVFLIEYLKKFYDVEVVLDESWNGGEFPDLSFIDESYLGVVFFQNLPGEDTLNKIKNDNIIFFPMYDGVPHDFAFWGNHYELKVINFSRTLHEKLAKWGFKTMCVQYFPDPQGFMPGNKDEVFFWQRLTKMDIDVISKLLGNFDAKIHIHKAIDPNQQFKKPSTEQERKYQITYSDWFETREEMWNVIKQKGVYIAPREFEGIGQSFLEAMAMGKAVVAVNNPTMNEYIKHGKTGYLFDLENPKEIDFSNIEQVQKNTHEFMKKGFEKWENSKSNIIDFIEKE